MASTKRDIQRWLDEAPEGSTHMLVICDTFDYEDYPVYVGPGSRTARDIAREDYGHPGEKGMQRLMGCYSFAKSIVEQLDMPRVYNFD